MTLLWERIEVGVWHVTGHLVFNDKRYACGYSRNDDRQIRDTERCAPDDRPVWHCCGECLKLRRALGDKRKLEAWNALGN